MLSGELEVCSYKSETQQEEFGRDKPTMSRETLGIKTKQSQS